MDQYPSNSLYNPPQQSDQPPKPNPVISREGVVSAKKPTMERIKDSFFGDHIFDNVIVPGLQNLFLASLETIFFHRTTRGPFYNQASTNNYWNNGYNGYGVTGQQYQYPSSINNYNQPQTQQPQQQVDYRNIILRNLQDAQTVINEMANRCQQYGKCTVADLLDMICYPSDYTDNNWGWRDPRYFEVQRVAQGFLIKVPPAQPLM